MASLLSAEEVRTALAALPSWTGDTAGLQRSVQIPESEQAEAERGLIALGDERNHHPDVERGPAGLRLVLSTHSAGGVTAKDVELAGAIDRLLAGGHPAS